MSQPKPQMVNPNPTPAQAGLISKLDPAGIKMSFGGILQILSSLSPVLLSGFFIISSLSNGNLKWVMYLAGFIILLFVFSITAFTIDSTFPNKDSRGSPYWKKECNLVALPFGLGEYMVPNFNSSALAFIFAYIFMPMLQYNSYNLILLSIIIVFFFINTWELNINPLTFRMR